MITQLSNIVVSLFTPFNYELVDYMGYDIKRFRKNITFLEVLVNRDGESNNIAPLYVDGAVTYFKELPIPSDTRGLQEVYKFMEDTKNPTKLFFIKTLKKLKFKHG